MNSWVDYLLNQYHQIPHKVAFKEKEKDITYGDLTHHVYQYYLYLKGLKLKEGTKLIVEAKRNYHYFALFGASILAKLVFVPLEEKIPSNKLNYYLSQFDDAYYLKDFVNIDLPGINNLDKLIDPIKVSKDDIGQILFTSGSESEPKGVVSTNEFFAQEAWMPYKDISVLVMIPVNHFSGINLSLSVLKVGGTVQFLDNAFDFNGFFDAFELYGANSFFATPSILKVYLDMGEEDMAKLNIKTAFVAGEYCSRILKERFLKAFNIHLISFYGSTECGLVAINSTEDDAALGYVFKGKKVSLIDEEIVISGDVIFTNYLNEEKVTQPFHTGDLGYMKDGMYYFKGRKDSIINTGGLKINPVEATTLMCNGVKDCLCVGKKDDDFQSIAILFYVGDISELEIKQFLMNNLELYKVPKEIYKIDEFKKNTNGKKDMKYYQNWGGK